MIISGVDMLLVTMRQVSGHLRQRRQHSRVGHALEICGISLQTREIVAHMQPGLESGYDYQERNCLL